MNIYDYDLDRFAKALNVQGFDLVLLLERSGSILAEKSTLEIDREMISEHIGSISQLASSLSDCMKGGPLHSAYFEFRDLKIVLGSTETFLLCGVPSEGTPQVFARNEIVHALQSLV